MTRPQVIVIAGPNGAGKSTAAAFLLPEGMTFVNADEIAQALPGYPSRETDIWAGRLVLRRMDGLEQQRADFAFETTLGSRSLTPRIARLRQRGYLFRLIFLSLPSADLAVQRVAGRVLQGGHEIPEVTIRRRFKAGMKDFLELYQPQADKWGVYDTVELGPPRLVAEAIMGDGLWILDRAAWGRFRGGDG